MSVIEYRDLGKMSYGEALKVQRALFGDVLERQRSCGDGCPAGTILTVEHPAVYTLGKSGHEQNLLVSEEQLQRLGAEFYRIDRGGDITFHGEGQIVGYPILDLSRLGIGLKRYIDILEETVIRTVARYGISGERLEGATGVWLCDRTRFADGRVGTPRNWRKICAIGVRASRFVTMHGLALNVNTDLKWFSLINPCGFTDKGVTSMERELGHKVDFERVKAELVEELMRLLAAEGAKQ